MGLTEGAERGAEKLTRIKGGGGKKDEDAERSGERQQQQKKKQYWCFFDVEATGPSLRDHFVPCIGLAVVEVFTHCPPKLITKKKWFMKPPDSRRSWDQETVTKFWMQPKTRNFYYHVRSVLESEKAVEPQRAMSEFVAICRSFGSSATLFSDTSGFDFSWLHYYLSHFFASGSLGSASSILSSCQPSTLFGFHKPVRDISSFFAGVSNQMSARYPHSDTMRCVGIDEQEWRDFARLSGCPQYDHDPENDAAHVALRSAWIVWRIGTLKKEGGKSSSSWRQRSLPFSGSAHSVSPSVSPSPNYLSSSSPLPPSLNLQPLTVKKRGESRERQTTTEESADRDKKKKMDKNRWMDKLTTEKTEKATATEKKGYMFLVRTDLRLTQEETDEHCAKALLVLNNNGGGGSESEKKADGKSAEKDQKKGGEGMKLYLRAGDLASLERVYSLAIEKNDENVLWKVVYDEERQVPAVLALCSLTGAAQLAPYGSALRSNSSTVV